MVCAVVTAILCIFAVYGAVRFILELSLRVCRSNLPKELGRHTVVFFHNDEDRVEGWIRALIREKTLDIGEELDDIIAVDTGSEDDTLRILKGLSAEYDFVYAMSIEDYIRFIKEY